MRFILKILAAPVIAVLTLFVWLSSGLLYCSSWIFGLAGTLLSILALVVLFTTSVKNGVILLVIAFLVSPMGLPLAASGLLGLIQRLRVTILEHVYG
ncbi:hypothetical protein OBV_30390 [Oscillibacter valericigenes Sjm18-20]|nr:hypothetical protein OBV_30390 [Oscillibacter valericigenes Sjm18-20]